MASKITTDKHDKDGSPSGHRARVRHKILNNGFSSFNDYEKIEAVLFNIIPRSDTKPLAISLVDTFGSFAGVLNAPSEELEKVPGCGPMVAFYLNFLAIVSKEYLKCESKKLTVFDDYNAIGEYCLSLLAGANNEKFIVVCLNDKNEFIASDIIESGGSYENSVTIKFINNIIVKSGGSKIIIAHNHPNGICIPSSSDIDFTNKLIAFLEPINVTLVAHYIIADGRYINFLNNVI